MRVRHPVTKSSATVFGLATGFQCGVSTPRFTDKIREPPEAIG